MADEIIHLSDLTQDPNNARLGNPRNVGMIVDSLQEVGAARSGVVDENNMLMSGNRTWEALAEAGIERVRVVESDGKTWVVVRRTGLTEEQKQRLALFDNRTSELATWDPEVLLAMLTVDEDALDGLFHGRELEELLGQISSPEPPEDFKEYGEDIDTDYCCPKCGYEWAGAPK